MTIGRLVLIIVGCVVSIGVIEPALGAYNYLCTAIPFGLAATFVAGWYAHRDHAPLLVSACLAFGAGVLSAAFWPAALVTLFAWLTFSDVSQDAPDA